jgi:hypothetical protein
MNEVVRAENPFTAAPERDALVEQGAQREIAEVQAAMVMARRNPRDQRRAMDRILNACSRMTLAESAVYQYARGGQDVSGASIRLAEAVAQEWGNIQFGVRELEQRSGVSTVEAYAWDLETNTRSSKVFQVTHVRHTKSGTKRLEDPRDIYEMVANQGARRLRACILAVIPGDVIEAAVAQCEVTVKTKVEITPEIVTKMVAAFAEIGVGASQISALIQRHIESMTPAQYLRLRRIYQSIRDGMSAPADWFEAEAAPEAAPKAAAVAAAIRRRQQPQPEEAPPPTEE